MGSGNALNAGRHSHNWARCGTWSGLQGIGSAAARPHHAARQRHPRIPVDPRRGRTKPDTRSCRERCSQEERRQIWTQAEARSASATGGGADGARGQSLCAVAHHYHVDPSTIVPPLWNGHRRRFGFARSCTCSREAAICPLLRRWLRHAAADRLLSNCGGARTMNFARKVPSRR